LYWSNTRGLWLAHLWIDDRRVSRYFPADDRAGAIAAVAAHPRPAPPPKPPKPPKPPAHPGAVAPLVRAKRVRGEGAPWWHRTCWRAWIGDGAGGKVQQSFATREEAVAALAANPPPPPPKRAPAPKPAAAPKPADAPKPRGPGVYLHKQSGRWIANLVTVGGGRREQKYQTQEDALSARKASELHPVSRTTPPLSGFGVRRALRSEAPPDEVVPSAFDEPFDEQGSGGAEHLPLVLLDPEPRPAEPMPPGWRFDPLDGCRRPIRPGEIVDVRPAAPPVRHLDAAEIEQLARSLGPRTISPKARAFRRSRKRAA
jgi:hypothetical protein